MKPLIYTFVLQPRELLISKQRPPLKYYQCEKLEETCQKNLYDLLLHKVDRSQSVVSIWTVKTHESLHQPEKEDVGREDIALGGSHSE